MIVNKIHTDLTAVPNITVPIGTARELAPSEILSADSTDYLLGGMLTMRNGRIDKYQFEEGYCQAEKYAGNAGQDSVLLLRQRPLRQRASGGQGRPQYERDGRPEDGILPLGHAAL